MGVIFITHDLGVVAEDSRRAVVMYKGEIVEQNTVKEIFTNPQHPYTKALLACRPVNHQRGERLPVVSDFLEEKRKSEVRSRKPDETSETNNANRSVQTSDFQTSDFRLASSRKSFGLVSLKKNIVGQSHLIL